MSDVVSSARTARGRLAQGLGALQGPGVPEDLMNVAEPIARAMSALHRVEASGGQAVREAGPLALEALRAALAMLQAQTINHPSVDVALDAVAESLGLVHQLVKVTSTAPPPQPVLVPVPAAAFAATAMAAAPAGLGGTVAITAGPAALPAVKPTQARPQAAPQPQVPPASSVKPVPVKSAPVKVAPVAVSKVPTAARYPAVPNTAGPANASGPNSAFAPNSTLPSHNAERLPPGGGPSSLGDSPFVVADTKPEAKPIVSPAPVQPGRSQPAPGQPGRSQPAPGQPGQSQPAPGQPVPGQPVPGQLRLETALGAHSPTNFYKGLSGNDVVDVGGIFVATYQIPRIGTPLLLKISLPGGYEFEAQAVVRWTREPDSAADGASPGFGAQFTVITPEGRQLVYRYVRNREPLFHDDL